MLHDTSPMIFYIMILTYRMLEIKKLSQRYADRLEKHSNVFATNLMRCQNTMQIKKRTYASDRVVIL